MKYAIVVEKTENGFSAYAPDLNGCIAAGDSYNETVERMREAIKFHIDGMRLNGEAVPPPTTAAEYVDVA